MLSSAHCDLLWRLAGYVHGIPVSLCMLFHGTYLGQRKPRKPVWPGVGSTSKEDGRARASLSKGECCSWQKGVQPMSTNFPAK